MNSEPKHPSANWNTIAADRPRNGKKTQKRMTAERRRRKTVAKGVLRNRVDEMPIGRVELNAEGSSESVVDVGDRTQKAQEDRSRQPHGGQIEAEVLALEILINFCAGKLGPCRSASPPRQSGWSAARRQSFGA